MNTVRNTLVFFSISLIVSCSLYAQPVLPYLNVPATPNTSTHTVNSYPDLYDFSNYTLRNFVRGYTPQSPTTNTANVELNPSSSSSVVSVVSSSYFDGLGRPIQNVQRKGIGTGWLDAIQPFTYDAVGRSSYQYLPYSYAPSNATDFGKLDVQQQTNLSGQYNMLYPTDEPYQKTEFDNSPLNKVVKVLKPGESWVGSNRGQTVHYETNDLSTDYVAMWSVGNTSSSAPSFQGYFSTGELVKVVSTDEDGKVTVEYFDKQNRVICKRVPNPFHTSGINVNWDQTYYVYDGNDKLRWVLTPEAVSQTAPTSLSVSSWSIAVSVLDALCYRYWYDDFGRLIEKQLPGKAKELMVYDRRNRLILTQDGNLRAANQNKWLFTAYDALDRATTTGIYIAGSASHQQLVAAASSTTVNYSQTSLLYYLFNVDLFNVYPSTGSDRDVYSYNYYDDYSATPSSFTFSAAFNSKFTGVAPYALTPSTASKSTRGLLTSQAVKVLDGASTPQWITTVYYYDDFGRLIQRQANTLTSGGKSIITNQYDFSGAVVCSVIDHTMPSAISPDPNYPDMHKHTTIVKKYTKVYENGNISKLEQDINSVGFTQIYGLTWDFLGRVSSKNYVAVNNAFSYNIQGWLTGINKGYIDNQNAALNTVFHEELSYDKGFASKLYSGNITGIRWRGAGLTAPKRYYGYSYDLENRLTWAEFKEAPAGTNSWSKATTDFTASDISYDNNGNILSMNQRGPGTSGPVDMDILSYDYVGNQLMKVSEDPSAAVSTLAPDFKDGSNTGSDYSYDPNGNLLTDANKGITSNILYNHLDKPTHVDISGKGYIDYIYDAQGNLLRKLVYSQATNSTEVFAYELPFVFKDNNLQYILHEEGRCRPKPTAINGVADYEYDFFVKDHLQNVRTVVNSQTAYLGPVLEYDATLEVAASQAESFLWSHLDDVRNNNPQSSSTGDSKAAELIGTVDSQRIGTTLMLRVMPGDRFNLSAESYFDAVGNTNVNTPDQLVSSLITALTGGSLFNNVPVSETPQNMMAINSTVGRGDFVQAYSSLRNQVSVDSAAPSSFINYVVFDEQGNLIADNSGIMQCGSSASQWNNVSVGTPIEIGQPGYILFFTSSEAANATFWDDITVTYQRGNVLEENHYYPFGLTLNSASANPLDHNKYLLTNKELQEEHDLNWYDFSARMYDEQIGRWLQVDPLTQEFSWQSPYCAMDNNPILNNDPTGEAASPSTEVQENSDGSYTVVGAANDGDNNIYKVDAKGKRTGEVVGQTLQPFDFLQTNDKTGTFYFDPTFGGNGPVTFNMRNTTVSGSVHPNKYTTVRINSANLATLTGFGKGLFRNEVERQSPVTFYGELEILKSMSGNGAPLDFKKSLGLHPYTPIRIGEEGSTTITTLRAAGNLTFGANMALTKPAFFSSDWYWSKVMPKVGAYNQSQNNGAGYNAGFPYYGEHTYSGSYIYWGYFNAPY